jgi:hypothetical protein
MKLIDHAEKLDMRHYIGLPLFGRSANFARGKPEDLLADFQTVN